MSSDLKACSVLSETDECEFGNVLSRWLMCLSWQFGNETLNPTLNLTE